MRIRAPKLPQDAMQTLRKLPADLWQPHQVLLAPVYVFLPRNEKFVAIKLPLQYFTEKELEKFKPYESFYLPAFVEQIEPFRKAGESVRELLVKLRQRCPVKTSEGNDSVLLPLAQHEVDSTVLHLTSPLWSASATGIRLEPFFLCFFADEVCLPFKPERLIAAFERDAEKFELALLRSSTAVFLALHVGYSDAAMLTRVRERIFDASFSPDVSPMRGGDPAALLEHLVSEAIPDAAAREISAERFREILSATGSGGALTRKLLSRLKRVSGESERLPSLFGEKGICDG